ncbi:hypothetical protein [Xylanibacter caecicola]|uniref:hypothetical protein n=1 Tax=Xylanibacter caecicola TaxID=2736294 RepID=UPI00258B88A4|nr:hypothetical protein [Xylanibacter caecicola]
MIKKKYISPSCEVIGVCGLSILSGSDKGNITINKEPYEGELNSKQDNFNIWDDEENKGDNGSLWDEY